MPSPKHGSRPERIGAILGERIDALGWRSRLREEELITGWDAAVGPQIAAHARPSHVTNRRLTVVTESPVWTQQLSLLKTELLRRIAAGFGPGTVTDLYFVTGKIEPAEPAPAPVAARRAPAAALPDTLERELDHIADADLRTSVRKLILAGLADEDEPGAPAAP